MTSARTVTEGQASAMIPMITARMPRAIRDVLSDLKSLPDAGLVAVGLGCVDVPVSEFERPSDGVDAFGPVRHLPDSEPEQRDVVAVREQARPSVSRRCGARHCALLALMPLVVPLVSGLGSSGFASVSAARVPARRRTRRPIPPWSEVAGQVASPLPIRGIRAVIGRYGTTKTSRASGLGMAGPFQV